METYTWTNSSHTTLVSGSCPDTIPVDLANSDYLKYLRWCEATSQTAAEYVAPVVEESPAKTALKTKLADLITSLNASYSGLRWPQLTPCRRPSQSSSRQRRHMRIATNLNFSMKP